MKFAQNTHPSLLFGPTRLFGTCEYPQIVSAKIAQHTGLKMNAV